MLRKITCYFLTFFFLMGSVIFPLGDFSLMRDIPKMYQNYTKITSGEEMGVIDFVGDYLLHGKDIFGHNEHDKTPAKGCDVQFQHQASSLNIVVNQILQTLFIVPASVLTHPVFTQGSYTSDYRNKLFRPPLA